MLTWFHHWLLRRQQDFAADRNRISGRTYRLVNELPTLALVVIVDHGDRAAVLKRTQCDLTCARLVTREDDNADRSEHPAALSPIPLTRGV